MVMTPDEFLQYIGQLENYRDKGKNRLSRARKSYMVYRKAYKADSLAALCRIASNDNIYPVVRAAMDRDAGMPMVIVEGL